MRVRFLLAPAFLLAGACSKSPADAGLCTFAAQVGGELYVLEGTVSADRVGAEHTRTVRQLGCIDGQSAPVAWQDGDSSFAPGTPLYASLDEPASEVLVTMLPSGRWLALRRQANTRSVSVLAHP